MGGWTMPETTYDPEPVTAATGLAARFEPFEYYALEDVSEWVDFLRRRLGVVLSRFHAHLGLGESGLLTAQKETYYMIRGSRYVIAVHDLERSAGYYQDILGFEVREIGDPGWRFFLKDNCLIMAGECPDALSPKELGDHSYFAYMEVDDIDQLHAALVAKRAQITKPLRAEPWGVKEFGLRTIDGHRIMFGCPVEGAGERS